MSILNLKNRQPQPKVDPVKKAAEKKADLESDKIPMEQVENDGLPLSPTSQNVDFESLGWLFVAPPGFGKSEFFSLFPGALMLSFEAGHKFINCFKIIIDEWDGKGEQKDDDGNLHMSFMEALNRIEGSSRFKFIILDTLDACVKKCVDNFVGKANVDHLSGLGDYGKGFDLGQNDPIRKAMNRLFNTGRGLGLITHQAVNTSSFAKGAKSKKETSLPNGIWKIVYPQMDVILHGEYGGIQDGKSHRDRIIYTEGNEDMLAKNRGGILPPAWIVPKDKQERLVQIKSFFDDGRTAAVAQAHKDYIELYEK